MLKYRWFSHPVMYLDGDGGTGGAAAGTGAGAGSGAGTGAGSGGGAGQGAGAATTTQGAGQGTGQPIDQLRSAYEGIKKEFEPYQKLGLKPEQITGYQTVYQRTYEQVASIGRQLGYPDDELVEALQTDPVKTLDYLRAEMQARQSGRQQNDPEAQLQERISQGIEEAMTPLNEWHNEQLTSTANAAFDREAYRLAGELFKKEGLDIKNIEEDELDAILFATSEYLKYDEETVRSLKYEGKTAGIAKAFNDAIVGLDKYYMARSKRSAGMPARPNGAAAATGAAQGGKKPTLDDIINNPGVLGQRYAER